MALALAIVGAFGAAILSKLLYGGEIVFPALMGACFGLAVAATGQRRMRIGASDIRSVKVQRNYANAEKREGIGQ